jgi:hypothetical protein
MRQDDSLDEPEGGLLPLMADAVQSFLLRHKLSTQGVTELLRLLHQAVEPDMAEQIRSGLPFSAATFHANARRRFKTMRDEAFGHQGPSELLHPDQVVEDFLIVGEGHVQEPFVHFDILSVLADMLVTDNSWEGDIQMDYLRKTDESGEQMYDEIYTGDWFRDTQQHVRGTYGPSKKVLSVILYVDGVTVDFFGNVSLIPVMMTIGNYAEAYRQTKAGKRLLGFIPSFTGKESQTPFPPSRLNRELMHAAMERFVDEPDFFV